MTKLQQLQAQVDEHQTKISKVQAFLSEWGPKLPETLTGGHLHWMAEDPQLCYFCYSGDRDTVLSGVGDVFGRDGWTRDLSSLEKSYHWRKTVSGVVIEINDAELIPPPVKPESVQPKEFPLQLADTKAPCIEVEPAF